MRLSRDTRREQLLELGMAIVREEGADELTLGRLAAKADVSRTVVYDHFDTRAGLLVALFQRLEERYVGALRAALETAPDNLAGTARVISEAYFNCLAELGPEGPAISAALKGSEEMMAHQQLMVGRYAEIMAGALRPFSSREDNALHLLCIALMGAAEVMALEVQRGRTTQGIAANVLLSLISGGLE
ncbi:TetR/AcrR family transcriptional regulator [Sphingomonas deserti]|uniref:TetR/AcrR family transcriptional regulator n=1 Tax=Allosphingosinicella deserti TaxID=2116704 RepID=A0A2P7QZD8_9SPHN|nr:TetR/AcrR family transcriptional regulator [Sphingomonas deserti]